MRGLGQRLDVTLNGEVAATVPDLTLKNGPMSGMTVQGADAGAARFDDFAATTGAAPAQPPPPPPAGG
jgi:hypothetical protein